jgi:hypothetical protein
MQLEENRGAESPRAMPEPGRRCALARQADLQRAARKQFEPCRRKQSGPCPDAPLHDRNAHRQRRCRNRDTREALAVTDRADECARREDQHDGHAIGDGDGRQLKGQAGVCRRRPHAGHPRGEWSRRQDTRTTPGPAVRPIARMRGVLPVTPSARRGRGIGPASRRAHASRAGTASAAVRGPRQESVARARPLRRRRSWPRASRAVQCRRATIIFLISAMAFEGFRSFGQASAQFMIVWQR